MTSLSVTSSSSVSPAQRRIVWGVRVLLALAFGAAGAAKLVGVQQLVELFSAIGFGQWFRYLTGAVEVVGALLMLIPAAGLIGGLLLTATCVGAVATHLLLIGGSPVPATVLGVLSAFIAWRQWPVSRPAATGSRGS
jgi:putative oxidoreductase